MWLFKKKKVAAPLMEPHQDEHSSWGVGGPSILAMPDVVHTSTAVDLVELESESEAVATP